MLERNEMRVRFYIAQLTKTIKEEHEAKQAVLQLELRNKLASIYLNDKDGFEKAIRFCGAYVEEKPEVPPQVVVVQHQPIQSKL